MIDADPIATAVRAMMATRTKWTGTASDLLGPLAEVADERVAKSKNWPDTPRALSGRLRRAATSLRKIGIEIAFSKEGRRRTRMILITKAASDAVPESTAAQPSAQSAPSATTSESNGSKNFAADAVRTVAPDADRWADTAGPGAAGTVRANPFKNCSGTAADGADAKIPTPSTERDSGWEIEL